MPAGWHPLAEWAVRQVAEVSSGVCCLRCAVRSSQVGTIKALCHGLHAINRFLCVQFTPRTYRSVVSESVRARWLDQECLYSVDVVVKSVHGAVWLNGREYSFGDNIQALASNLNTTMKVLISLLECLRNAPIGVLDAGDLADLRSRLADFDLAWARLEQGFIVEVSQFEALARGALVQAITFAVELYRVKRDHHEGVDLWTLSQDCRFLHSHSRLVCQMSRLSATIDPGGAGGGLHVHMLSLLKVVAQETAAHGSHCRAAVASPTFALAYDAALAWDHLCSYVYEMRHRVESFSPELSENAELVRLLAAWNSSLAPASAYVIDPRGRIGLHSSVQFIQGVEAAHPAFASMLDDCSSELFVVLPRLIWLRFLESPSAVMKIIALLLPHHFEEFCKPCGSTYRLDAELIALIDAHAHARCLLVRAATARGLEGPQQAEAVRAAFICCAVDGFADDSCRTTLQVFLGPKGTEHEEACKSFMRVLEGLSVELHRHSAQGWNAFCAILIRCASRNHHGHICYDKR